MRPRVLFCANAYPPNFIGGAELITHYHASCLKRLGHPVMVFAGEPGGPHHTPRQDTYEDVPVLRYGLHHPDYYYEFVNFQHNAVDELFERTLDQFRPDVVHMHNLIGLSVGMIHRAKRRGIKTVLTLHDLWGFCFKNTLIKRPGEICDDFSACEECLPRISDGEDRNLPIRMRHDYIGSQFREVDAFISPSLYLARQYVRAGVPVGRMWPIWNGVDVGQFSAVRKTPAQGKTRFTFAGHFGHHKGIPVLLDAVAQLGHRDDYQVNMVGSGDLLEPSRAFVEERQLGSIVRFRGKIENSRMRDVLAETDVFVLPSVWPENQPVTLTEAMATSTAIIASDMGGVPEMVTHGVSGYLFKSGSVEELAARMSDMIGQPERARAFGEAGFERIRHKTYENQVERILEVYRD